MEDELILELYYSRSEIAIAETANKYGRYCHSIAYHILADVRDADEVVNDTYMGAWNSLPPHHPSVLSTYLGKITRRISINRWNERKADKRGQGEIPLALDELTEAIPSPVTPEQTIVAAELTKSIDRFLSGLPEMERDMFVCRYWFLAPVAEISSKFGYSASKTKSILFRTRNKLKDHLQKEGYL